MVNGGLTGLALQLVLEMRYDFGASCRVSKTCHSLKFRPTAKVLRKCHREKKDWWAIVNFIILQPRA